MAIPLHQKWDGFELHAHDKYHPNYYLGPKAELYYSVTPLTNMTVALLIFMLSLPHTLSFFQKLY